MNPNLRKISLSFCSSSKLVTFLQGKFKPQVLVLLSAKCGSGEKCARWGAATGFLLFSLVLFGPARAEVPIDHAYIVNSYPHDPKAFTEGLFYKNGYLYESTGLMGQSSIRKEKLETGQILEQRALDSRYFGEGIVDWKSELVQLTWQSQIGFVYDFDGFKFRRTFQYSGEGWGLTRDDQHIIMSDGTNTLRFLDPNTLTVVGTISVTADGRAVQKLNELEWVKGEIYANIWETNVIARIDPKSGEVLGWIDLSNVVAAAGVRDIDAVLNGIAYDPAHDRLFVTGKLWPWVFEIRLAPPRQSPHRAAVK